MSNYTYMVTNNINGKVYVGSHSWDGEGLDPNYYGSGTAITKAVKKYGKENFQVEVLYYYDTVEECRKDEERILTEYNVKDCPHSYNCKNSAIGFSSEDMKGEKHPNYGKRGKDTSMYGKHHTEETRRKISQAFKGENNPMYGKRGKDAPFYGKHHTEDTKRKMSEAHKGRTLSEAQKDALLQANNYRKTPIVAIDKNNKVKIFESQKECSRVLGVDQRDIRSCLKGKQKTCKGYTFKYLEQLESGIYEGITELALEPSKRTTTPVIAIQKGTGRVRMFLSQAECSRILGVIKQNINGCLKGRIKSTGGYTFKNINRDKRVFKVSPRSKADINTLRGIRKQTGGYTFKYLEQLESGIYEGIL